MVADVSGSYKGRVFFTGKPFYNPEKRSLEISEPEFDIKTGMLFSNQLTGLCTDDTEKNCSYADLPFGRKSEYGQKGGQRYDKKL